MSIRALSRGGLVLALLLSLSGCQNYRELNDFDFAIGLAVDYRAGVYEVTVELLDLTDGEQEAPVSGLTVDSRGETLPYALESLRSQLSRELYLGNLKQIIIGERTAREMGLTALCDWFLRDMKIRETVPILIAKGAAPKEILSTPGLDNPIASNAIAEILTPVRGVMNNPQKADLYQLYEDLAEPGRALTLPTVTLVRQGENVSIAVDGLAVFDGDRPGAYIDMETLPWLLLLRGEMGPTERVFETDRGRMTVRCIDSHTRRSFQGTETGVRFTFAVEVEALILEMPPGIDAGDKDERQRLEAEAAGQIKTALEQTAALLQEEIGLDALALGHEIYLKDAPLWQRVGADWQRGFSACEIAVETRVSLIPGTH